VRVAGFAGDFPSRIASLRIEVSSLQITQSPPDHGAEPALESRSGEAKQLLHVGRTLQLNFLKHIFRIHTPPQGCRHVLIDQSQHGPPILFHTLTKRFVIRHGTPFRQIGDTRSGPATGESGPVISLTGRNPRIVRGKMTSFLAGAEISRSLIALGPGSNWASTFVGRSSREGEAGMVKQRRARIVLL
jgi:hypothetical protein